MLIVRKNFSGYAETPVQGASYINSQVKPQYSSSNMTKPMYQQKIADQKARQREAIQYRRAEQSNPLFGKGLQGLSGVNDSINAKQWYLNRTNGSNGEKQHILKTIMQRSQTPVNKTFSSQLPNGDVVNSKGDVISSHNANLYKQHEDNEKELKKYRNREAFAIGLRERFPKLGQKLVNKYSDLVNDTIRENCQPYNKILSLQRERKLALQPVRTYSELEEKEFSNQEQKELLNKFYRKTWEDTPKLYEKYSNDFHKRVGEDIGFLKCKGLLDKAENLDNLYRHGALTGKILTRIKNNRKPDILEEKQSALNQIGKNDRDRLEWITSDIADTAFQKYLADQNKNKKIKS